MKTNYTTFRHISQSFSQFLIFQSCTKKYNVYSGISVDFVHLGKPEISDYSHLLNVLGFPAWSYNKEKSHTKIIYQICNGNLISLQKETFFVIGQIEHGQRASSAKDWCTKIAHILRIVVQTGANL